MDNTMEKKSPLTDLMRSTMEKIHEMVDTNTIVGQPITTPDGVTLIPISKVSFGFVAGGGEYETSPKPQPPALSSGVLPFAGGTGAGVSVCPLGFLIVGKGQVKMLPAQHETYIDRLVELAPVLLEDVKRLFMDGEEEPAPQDKAAQDPTTPPNPF